MIGTWTTIELCEALEMGYKITAIYAATSYTSVKGLMKDYVMHFLRMKICNNNPMNKDQGDAINRYHKRIGFKEWKDIAPEETSKTPD